MAIARRASDRSADSSRASEPYADRTWSVTSFAMRSLRLSPACRRVGSGYPGFDTFTRILGEQMRSTTLAPVIACLVVGSAVAPVAAADVLLVNGKVWTVDRTRPEAEAVAI